MSSFVKLIEKFSRLNGVILKGGHIDADLKDVTDILIYKDGKQIKDLIQTHPRYRTKNTHGTGCTFSSAFAAFLAKKQDAAEAFSKAVSYVNKLIELSKDLSVGHGHGPLLHHALDLK